MPEENQQDVNTQLPMDEDIQNQPLARLPVMATSPSADLHTDSTFRKINRITAIVLMVSAILFATVSLLAIWDIFGRNTVDIVWRSFVSLATIAFTSLVVNIASRLVEQNHSR